MLMWPSVDPRFKCLRQGLHIPESTRLGTSLSRIRTWLEACERLHPICSPSGAFLPVRLLDLTCGDQSMTRLISTTHFDLENRPASRYACLSHCWGETRSPHLTTKSNLQANMEAIPIIDLLQTFQDSIEVCRALNISYLWIDTFCIIQDDLEDWQAHVVDMSSIYENAYLTLAAGASRDGSGGLFKTTVSRDYTAVKTIELPSIGGEPYRVQVRRQIHHPDFLSLDGPEDFPLMRRGWAFQEKLLSKRYLCFGDKEILWECCEDVACSCSVTSGPFNPRLNNQAPAFLCSKVTHKFYSDLKHTFFYLIVLGQSILAIRKELTKCLHCPTMSVRQICTVQMYLHMDVWCNTF